MPHSDLLLVLTSHLKSFLVPRTSSASWLLPYCNEGIGCWRYLSCTQLIPNQDATGYGIQHPLKGPGSSSCRDNISYNEVNPTWNIKKLSRFMGGGRGEWIQELIHEHGEGQSRLSQEQEICQCRKEGSSLPRSGKPS